MASGCVPSHASYFLAYEHLKVWLDFQNESYSFVKPLCIGCTTTFVHDFFITPADGKWSNELILYHSFKAATAIMPPFICNKITDENNSRRGNQRALQILPDYSQHECALCNFSYIFKRESQDLHKAMGTELSLPLVLLLCWLCWRICRTSNKPTWRSEDAIADSVNLTNMPRAQRDVGRR